MNRREVLRGLPLAALATTAAVIPVSALDRRLEPIEMAEDRMQTVPRWPLTPAEKVGVAIRQLRSAMMEANPEIIGLNLVTDADSGEVIGVVRVKR